MRVERFGPESGRPVLLLHGGGVAGWMWRATVAELEHDFRLVVPDLPGHDGSAGEDYPGHEATVARLVALLEEQPAPSTVVGFSLGAQLAVLLAARRSDLVDRVVVVSAQAEPTRHPAALLALLRATAGLAHREWFARLQASQLFIPPDLLGDYLRTSALVSRATLLAAVGDNIRFTIPDGWSAFPGDALVLAGERESAFMRRSARVLHAATARGDLQIVPGCGHGIPLQRPEWWAELLRERLTRD